MTELIFNSFITLLVVVDPLGLAPIFAALTRGTPKEYKREAAIRGTFLGAIILLVFALVGERLLEALGIGLPAFRIAGGALLFLTALDMVFGRSAGRSSSMQQQNDESHKTDISVFPLAIPLISGPGAITTVLLYTGGRSVLEMVAFLGVLVVVLALVLFSLLLAPRVMGFFGDTSANVLSRVLGVLLAALAVQFILDGLQTSLHMG